MFCDTDWGCSCTMVVHWTATEWPSHSFWMPVTVCVEFCMCCADLCRKEYQTTDTIHDCLLGHLYPKLRQYTMQAQSWAVVDVSDSPGSKLTTFYSLAQNLNYWATTILMLIWKCCVLLIRNQRKIYPRSFQTLSYTARMFISTAFSTRAPTASLMRCPPSLSPRPANLSKKLVGS